MPRANYQLNMAQDVPGGDRSGSSCGRMRYCSRTDLKIVQFHDSLPSVGNLVGSNTAVVDPDFNNRVVRVTDANTDPSHRAFTFVATASGSADENTWNADSTMFVAYHVGGGAYPFAFDAQSMKVSRLYESKFPSTAGFLFDSPVEWSRTDPRVLYEMSGTKILAYTFANRRSPPSPHLVYDFRSSPNCLGANFPHDPWSTIGGVAAGDSSFAMGFSSSGGQDGPGANFVAVYYPRKGCRVLNTATGQVAGDWGPIGTIDIPDRVHIHNAKLSKDGNWVVITWNKCLGNCPHSQPFFWDVSTLHIFFLSSCPKNCPGHWTEGSTHFFYENANRPPDFHLLSFLNTGSFIVVNPSQPPGFSTPWDQHPSWNNSNPQDNTPVCTSSFTPSGAPPLFAFAWQDEILCIATDGSDKVWRFAHTFNTDRSHRFSTSEAIGTVSQDGRYFIFSSDWMGTLGSESGAPTCKIGTNCRGDVFIVELK